MMAVPINDRLLLMEFINMNTSALFFRFLRLLVFIAVIENEFLAGWSLA